MSATDDVLGRKDSEIGKTELKTSKTGLFDPKRLAKVGSMPPDSGARHLLPALEMLTLVELLDLRSKIDERLPARSLADLDLEEEVLLQFARTKALYDSISENNEVPANQRAQVANSCTSILDQLIKMQARLYSAERVKALEQVLVKTLKTIPEQAQKDFFERYERALEDLAAMGAKTK